MERREVIGGGLAAGLSSLFPAAGAEGAVAAPRSADNDELVAAAVHELRRSLERQADAGQPGRLIAAIREQQRIYLRASHKYPDFIEVGLGVWESVYDWHVKYQQPITATRLADGRYAMTFMFTSLLLRPDLSSDYVGYGFDADTPGRPSPVR